MTNRAKAGKLRFRGHCGGVLHQQAQMTIRFFKFTNRYAVLLRVHYYDIVSSTLHGHEVLLYEVTMGNNMAITLYYTTYSHQSGFCGLILLSLTASMMIPESEMAEWLRFAGSHDVAVHVESRLFCQYRALSMSEIFNP